MFAEHNSYTTKSLKCGM